MAPVCFVIRSGVKRCRRRSGGGQTAGEKKQVEGERTLEEGQISRWTE